MRRTTLEQLIARLCCRWTHHDFLFPYVQPKAHSTPLTTSTSTVLFLHVVLAVIFYFVPCRSDVISFLSSVSSSFPISWRYFSYFQPSNKFILHNKYKNCVHIFWHVKDLQQNETIEECVQSVVFLGLSATSLCLSKTSISFNIQLCFHLPKWPFCDLPKFLLYLLCTSIVLITQYWNCLK